MTEDRMALLAMAEKAGETDFLRDLVREVLQELMEAEVDSRCGAQRHERNAERTDHRNGYRSRRRDTRVGSMELSIPRLRNASYLPGFLEPRRAAEQALTAVVLEQSEEWQVGRCYMAKHCLAELHDGDNDEPWQIDNAA